MNSLYKWDETTKEMTVLSPETGGVLSCVTLGSFAEAHELMQAITCVYAQGVQAGKVYVVNVVNKAVDQVIV